MDKPFTIRYLGVAGWHLQSGGTSLIIDPFFTRPPMWQVTLRLRPDREAIRRHMPPADYILVTHPHYDHIMDVPTAAALSSAQVYASPQGCALLTILGLPVEQIHPVEPGSTHALSAFRVRVFESAHRVIFGRVPAFGPLAPKLVPPLRALDYRIQRQYSFHITTEGISVLVASGIDEEPQVQADIVLVGADASLAQLERVLSPAQPAVVMPNHWDDMFRPVDKPPRPTIKPTRRITLPRRVNLEAWQRAVQAIVPGAAVMIPRYFEPYDLRRPEAG